MWKDKALPFLNLGAYSNNKKEIGKKYEDKNAQVAVWRGFKASTLEA